MPEADFKTEDMTLAAYLTMQGFNYELRRLMSRPQRKWITFLFKGVASEAHEISAKFYAGEVTVEPRKFMEVIGRVRSEIYDATGHTPTRLRASSE